ncbi:Prolyl 4-hydroxylase subunit alpha-2-like Protein [Tribolium castaneum]|uniref:procollagen-proline 4-dioxygenase n=2 Tax=Tribolium castaneum TaxID=7070 RepID=D6X3Y9_TRICA|nr:PREDICTED: prolyl 4-hydroxylase subunit alpha-2 [Tribolium castaneum]XP_015839511.1 PREDICTED: prolyl 4-hydroxylase subunit alpha-2 [Tribolium castaneum]EEZ97484.1 Prolyl 4-hydroxylase subunit alpha-2-like Protein [Tribolium castaneum]|eukprot:XP_015839510.1 PREDICTED: prolyl 4-hydroxylase subunit alpha-2 [Tribolium castaneum]
MANSLLLQAGLLICSICAVRSEVFTALADLEDLLETEALLINTLENYIKAEEEKLGYLKRYAAIYKNQHDKASENVQVYVANPINAYTLVKRLTADWREVENLINSDLSLDCLANITHIKETMKFPTDEDLNGAAVALTRLQDTYRLDTSSLARGELNGVKYSSELSAADCFELGRQSYNNEDYYHTQLWMREADARLKREANETVDRSDILEYLAFSTYKQGNIPLALDLTNKLLEILPSHPRALGNKIYYEDELQKSVNTKKKGDDGGEPEGESKPYVDPYGREFYEQLCRGEISLPVEKASKLKCFYLSRNQPFLKIAPFKVEEAHHRPDIFIFRDVLADSEIATIKRMAQPRFKRATVQNTDTGELEIAQYRISKSAWLKEEEHKHIADVSQRVSDMTGLTMSTAEELQVVNYGIGGHYEPHFDFARRDERNAFKSLGTGNRIATVLFYMSDVEQGGATVFPSIQVSLWPQKGSAAFWYNLHPSGDGDKMTRHAACPVLTGSKWVSNKWIHERGQEFRRPCTLERPSEDLVA